MMSVRSHFRFFRGSTVLAVFLGLLLSAPCSFAADEPIRMAYLQNDLHHLALWVAQEKGFFKDEGLNVEIAGIFRAGPEIMAAYGAGDLDAAYVGEAPTTIAVSRGTAKVKVLAQANTEGSALVVNKDIAPNQDPKPVVAVPGNGTVQDLLLHKILDKLGMTTDDIKRIVMSPPGMLAPLSTDEIQAFIAWESYPAKAVTNGKAHIQLTSKDIWKDHPCCVLTASDAFIKKAPEQVEALVRAHRKATDYISQHTEEAMDIAVKYTGMERAVIASALERITYTATPSIEGEEEYVRYLDSLGYIDEPDAAAFTKNIIMAQ